MALNLHTNNTKKAPFFDGTNYAYWKVKMTAHLKSSNREVWKVTETKFEVANENAPTPVEEKNYNAMILPLVLFMKLLMTRPLSKLRTLRLLMMHGQN